MVKWVISAFAVLLLTPLSAAAAGTCRHEQNHGISHTAHVDHHAMHSGSIESIPATGIAAPCPEHSGESVKIKAHMMPRCSMEGCCIKADGPLSTGLSNRLPSNDNHALSLSTVHIETDGRLVDATPHRLHPQRNLPEPDPRPPAA